MYKPLRTPRSYQLDSMRKAWKQPAFGLLSDFGTGKSKILNDEFAYLVDQGLVDQMLIIAPAGCYQNWEGEFKDDYEESFLERFFIFRYHSGMNKGDEKKFDRFLNCHSFHRILIVNIEALQAGKEAGYLLETLTLYVKALRTYMAVDESVTIKNWDSGRTEAVLSIGPHAAFRRIATGLIAPNGIIDIFSQFWFLDWRILGFKSIYTFKKRYCIVKKVFTGRLRKLKNGTWKPITVNTIVGYNKNINEIYDRIEPFTMRIPKDVLGLPLKIYMPPRRVKMPDQQARIYRELVEQACAQLEDGTFVTPQQKLTVLMRLQQVLCGFTKNDAGDIIHISNTRLDTLMEVLDQHSGKAIIWVPEHPALDMIVNRIAEQYGPRSFAQFHGMNMTTRSEDEKRFKKDPDCRFMVSTQSCGGRGNTWIVADLVCYYANSFDLDDRMNSEDRPHRLGQEKSVTYVDLICPKTIDETVLKCLKAKKNIANVINRDNVREWVI